MRCFSHKNIIAAMKVSVPLMIINLEESRNKCMSETLNLIVPLPWFKSCSVYVQGTKAEKS